MKLGILGHPIEHSLSHEIFKILAQEFSQDISYDVVNVPLEEFNFTTLKANYDGLNITFPYKEKILDYIDNYNMLVSRTKSANTIILKGNPQAYNTDVEGFDSSLDHYTIDTKGMSVLVCGGGGAARSVLQVLCHNGVKSVQLKLRDNFKFENAAKHFQALYPDVEFTVYNDHTDFDMVINATTLGLVTTENKNEADLFFKNIFRKTKIAYDLNYKEESSFLKIAEQNNVETRINGVMMLIHQALFAYEKWFHKIENKSVMAQKIKDKLR